MAMANSNFINIKRGRVSKWNQGIKPSHCGAD
jgi:hypothetical protein